jgi:hypothetical protein
VKSKEVAKRPAKIEHFSFFTLDKISLLTHQPMILCGSTLLRPGRALSRGLEFTPFTLESSRPTSETHSS